MKKIDYSFMHRQYNWLFLAFLVHKLDHWVLSLTILLWFITIVNFLGHDQLCHVGNTYTNRNIVYVVHLEFELSTLNFKESS